jgi:hypothetical protein
MAAPGEAIAEVRTAFKVENSNNISNARIHESCRDVGIFIEMNGTLFKPPMFAGTQSATEWRYISQPGNVLIRDARYWVPLAMLVSGTHPGEIA